MAKHRTVEEFFADNAPKLDAFFAMCQEKGYELYGPNEWRQIMNRYRSSLAEAEKVPRELIYFDISILVAAIEAREMKMAEMELALTGKTPTRH